MILCKQTNRGDNEGAWFPWSFPEHGSQPDQTFLLIVLSVVRPYCIGLGEGYQYQVGRLAVLFAHAESSLVKISEVNVVFILVFMLRLDGLEVVVDTLLSSPLCD